MEKPLKSNCKRVHVLVKFEAVAVYNFTENEFLHKCLSRLLVKLKPILISIFII